MRTQVGIIGGGSAGLLFSLILHRNGVESVVLERRSREYVLGRIRAGVLEWGSVEVLRNAGVGERLDREGRVHDGARIAWAGRRQLLIDTRRYTGRPMVAYGQTQHTEDLYAAHDAMGGGVIDEAEEVTPHGVDTDVPLADLAQGRSGASRRRERHAGRVRAQVPVCDAGGHGRRGRHRATGVERDIAMGCAPVAALHREDARSSAFVPGHRRPARAATPGAAAASSVAGNVRAALQARLRIGKGRGHAALSIPSCLSRSSRQSPSSRKSVVSESIVTIGTESASVAILRSSSR